MMLGVSLSTLAHDFYVGGIYYNILNKTAKTVEVTFSGSSYIEVAREYTGDVVIPNSVTYSGNTYSVTSIDYSAFYGCSGLTSVTIPNSMTSIGSYAFDGCTGLTEVNITDLSAWCKIDFGGASSNPLYYAKHLKLNGTEITNLVIPNDITEIKNYTFYGCDGLTSVTIPNSVTSIGIWAFYGCTGLTEVTIPNSVTSIGESAFRDCTGLTEVTIGNSVTSIVSYAFYGCTSLKSITIPNSVTSIGNYAFKGCEKITEISIPKSITSINSWAFEDCSALTTIKFEDGDEGLTIGNNYYNFNGYMYYYSLFYDCPLQSVYLGRNISYKQATGNTNSVASPFMGNIKSVTIGKYVTELQVGIFGGCSQLSTVIWNSISCPDLSQPIFTDASSNITSFSFGNSVEHIPANLCNGLSGLASITIPKSVKSIGDLAFNGCNFSKVYSRPTIPPTLTATTFTSNIYENATLYVYENSSDIYMADEYWQNFFNVSTLSGGEEIPPIYLTIKYPESGIIIHKEDYNESVDLSIVANQGWKVNTVTFNDEDVTSELDEEGNYTTPVLTTDAVLAVVFEKENEGGTTEIVTLSTPNDVKVYVSDSAVNIVSAEENSEVVIYDIIGNVIYRGTEKSIPINQCGVYILTIANKTFKFAI